MSRLTDALAEFVDALVEHRELRAAPEVVQNYMEQRCARAADAYEDALAQFTADVARHAVT